MSIVLSVALVSLAACSTGGSETAAPSSPDSGELGDQFGGELTGTDALVGIASGPERVTVYVCDDGTISEWFVTDAPAEQMTLVSTGGAVAELTIGEDEVVGAITLADGSRHEFSAERQSAPVIHRAQAQSEDDAVLAGWVTVGERTVGALGLTPKGGGTALKGPAPKLPIKPTAGSPTRTVSLPTPTVSLPATVVTVTGDATFVTANRDMTFVVAGVGDSYASGEGNPVDAPDSSVEEPGNLGSMWGDEYGMNGCHRSDNAGIPLAFRALEEKYPEFDMKLAFVACGGSRVEHVTGRPAGQAPGAGEALAWGQGVRGDANDERTDRWEAINEPAQLAQVDSMVEGFGTALPVDVLAMSIGGNDAGFAPVVGRCVAGGVPATIDDVDAESLILAGITSEACDEDSELADAIDDDGLSPRAPTGNNAADNEYAKLGRDVPGWIEVGERHAALDATLEKFATAHRPIGQVLITQYGVGLKDGAGNYCGGRSGNTDDDIFGFIDPGEAEWIDTNLVSALNQAVTEAAANANVGPAGPRWKVVGSHVAPFVPHGPCAGEPWTHINATALAAQGNNLPDAPFDDTREKLAQLNTALATITGAAIGCGVTALSIVLNLVGCAAGAATGLIVGLATNAEESAVSAGMAHPNDIGWEAVGTALFPEFDAAFQRTFTPLPPDRLRQRGATENGGITMRWDDRSSTESRYEIEIYEDANAVTPVASVTDLPANSVEHTFAARGPFVGTFRVRACNEAFCSPFSGRTKITNIKPSVPTGLSALVYQNQTLAVDLPNTLVVLATDPRNADTATRIELTQLTNATGATINANPTEFNVPAPFPSVFTFGGTNGIAQGLYRVRAASCNVFGCSAFGPAAESRPAPPGPPQLKAELPPFLMDVRGNIIPRKLPSPSDPTGQSGPVTIPPPETPGG